MPNDVKKKAVAKLINTWEGRNETLGKALVGFAFSRIEEGGLKTCFGHLFFLKKGDMAPKPVTYDYGNFILDKRPMEAEEALNLISSIFERETLEFGEWQNIPLKVHPMNSQFVPSHGRYGYFSSDWPTYYFFIEIEESTRGNIPYEPLSKIGLPLFPRGEAAIEYFFDMRLPEDGYNIPTRIEILVPDYRARIKSFQLAKKKVTVEAETGVIDKADVRAKFYCKCENQIYISDEIPLKDGCASFEIGANPLLIEAHIISASKGETIDRRWFDYRRSIDIWKDEVIIEDIEDQLLEIINRGENINVEFKKELSESFIETVIAFANTHGGRIFLGVDDNCRVVGFRKDDKSRIENMVADSCDPIIEVKIRDVFCRDTPSP
jgi:hypothetical protein